MIALRVRPATVASILLVLAFASAFITFMIPRAQGATFGITTTTGMSTYSASGYLLLSSFVAPSGGTLSQISFFITGVSGTQTGNVGIYADGSGLPGSLLATSTPKTIQNGQNDFSTLSASVTIVPSTSYWLAYEVTGGMFYYTAAGPAMRAYATKSCCTFPTTGSGATKITGSYAMFAVYTTGADFSISSTPSSQNVAAGGTASFTLDIAAQGGFSGTVNLSVSSGCPLGVTCTVNPNSINVYPNTATLSVPTLITTSGSYNVVVTGSNGSITHAVTVAVTVAAPNSYNFNVRPGATQIVITVSWTGTATVSATIAGPGGSPTIAESAGVIYDRTSVSVSGGTPTTSYIHRVTFTIAAPASPQTWTLLLSISGTSTYNVTIEVS